MVKITKEADKQGECFQGATWRRNAFMMSTFPRDPPSGLALLALWREPFKMSCVTEHRHGAIFSRAVSQKQNIEIR